MKKWVMLYIVIFLASVGILSCAVGLSSLKEVSFEAIEQEGGYASQVIRTDAHEYVCYQNPEQEKFFIAKTDKTLQDYETLATLHQNGVYFLYRYETEGTQSFGIEPLGAAKGEAEWQPVLFSAEGNFFAAGSNERAIFCSILSEDGRTITEYEISLADDGAEWEERMTLAVPEGHFAVCGAYEGDTLWIAREDGVIYRRTDLAKEWSGDLTETPLAAAMQSALADGAKGTWRLKSIMESMEQMLLPGAALAILITLLCYGWKKENHIIYRLLCCTGILSMLALCYVGLEVEKRLVQQEVLETGVEAGHVLEEMKSSQRADGTVAPAAYWAAMQQREGLLDDLLIVKPESGKILLAKEFPAGEQIDAYYGVEAQALILQVAAGNEALMTRLPKGDSEVYAVAMRDWRSIEPDSVLLAILSADGIEESILPMLTAIRLTIGGLMAAVFVIHILLFVLFGKRWRKFVEGISFVATEKKTYPEIPQGGGLQEAWVPLDSIGNNLSRLYYERELLYRRYYRFVPKNMETLLNKAELADIEIGDSNQIRGCMAYFLLDNMKNCAPSEYMDVMTRSLELMHEVRVKRDGIFLSAGMDLQERKIFFEQNARNALQFSVDLLHAFAENALLAENDLIFLLYAAEFQYGISGVKDMTTPYMYSRQESILEPYAKRLAKTKVKIAMTEQTMRLIGDGFSTRYIGFVSGGEEYGSLKLYECLDAYPENQRKRMLQTEVMFQRALQLFYSNDFYLARNTFNEVLKINEKDHIARWYLFHCEYHLNKPEAEVSYGLFENTVIEQEYDRV